MKYETQTELLRARLKSVAEDLKGAIAYLKTEGDEPFADELETTLDGIECDLKATETTS